MTCLNLRLAAALVGAVCFAAAAPAHAEVKEAPPMMEVLSHIRQLQRGWPESRKALEDYKTSLQGLHVTNWRGWVGRVAKEDGKFGLNLFAEDPYALPAPPPPAGKPRAHRHGEPDQRGLFLIVLDIAGVDPETLQRGQEVKLNATITTVEDYSGLSIQVRDAQVSAVPLPTLPLPALPELKGVNLTLSRGLCFGSCPVYDVSVDGDGTVHWTGKQNVKVVGPQTAQLPLEKVQALLAAFNRAGFFALQDYVAHDVTDGKKIVLGLRWRGRNKTVVHSSGDLTAPSRLIILESQVDTIIGTAQWIGNKSGD